MGKFEITARKNDDFQFVLKATNGQVILASQGYKSKTSCLNGVESVKNNAPDDSKYERKVSSNGKHFFNLKATNGQVIGSSQMYASASGMENGIKSIKTNAPIASTDDQTA